MRPRMCDLLCVCVGSNPRMVATVEMFGRMPVVGSGNIFLDHTGRGGVWKISKISSLVIRC